MIHPLVHMHQKKKIALGIAARIASVRALSVQNIFRLGLFTRETHLIMSGGYDELLKPHLTFLI
jgi:hypothetical protein